MQQLPSAQNPDSHCDPSKHAAPAGRLAPQAAPEQQTPCAHLPVVQSLSQPHSCPGSRLGSEAPRHCPGTLPAIAGASRAPPSFRATFAFPVFTAFVSQPPATTRRHTNTKCRLTSFINGPRQRDNRARTTALQSHATAAVRWYRCPPLCKA